MFPDRNISGPKKGDPSSKLLMPVEAPRDGRGNIDWSQFVASVRVTYGDSGSEFADRMQRTGILGDGITAATEELNRRVESGEKPRFEYRRQEQALQHLADTAPDKPVVEKVRRCPHCGHEL